MFDEIVVGFLHGCDLVLRQIGDFVGRPELVILRINDRLLIDHIELTAQLIFPA